MNLSTDSGRKWGIEPESKPKLKENICIIKLCPIKWLIPQSPIDTNTLFPWVQSVQFDKNKWISGLIRDENEL